MLHENEANRKQGKQHSNGLIFWSSKAEYLFKKKKEVKQIHCTLNENPMLCLGTQSTAKTIYFFSHFASFDIYERFDN